MIKKLLLTALFTLFLQSQVDAKISYYGDYFHGRKTANGERFDMNAFTAAHKTLPFNTLVKITVEKKWKDIKYNISIIVRINDRGPYIKGRKLDLSKKAFQTLMPLSKGVITNYKLEIL